MPHTAMAAIAPEPTALLKTRTGLPVPLQGVTAKGRLDGLLFALTVEQRYQNTSDTNIEAVFTFPLPVHAVLLGFELEIGERRLQARAVGRQEASETYEHAVDEGNSAALIEHQGDGLYTVSLGNLMARESAVIRYRYAELLDAHDGRVRLQVPTVIAPRYGDPKDAGLEGPAVPGVDVFGEYGFELSLELAGLRDVNAVRSPSHQVTCESGETGLSLRLARPGFLDRDFVLEVDQATMSSSALCVPDEIDGASHVVLASTTLELDGVEQCPLALKVLLDCSGSMGGDSIAAARRALLAVLERLAPEDLVSLTRFGSNVEHVSEGMEPADEHSLRPLKALVRKIDADLGGTNMGAAIEATLAIKTPRERVADFILITDGEIHDVAGVIGKAAKSGHRLFAIAIGAAPNEALARQLAEKTGGACEFVGPGEDAEAAILRMFKRLRATPRRVVAVDWPVEPLWTAPLPSAVFPGDTLHLFAAFANAPQGEVVLRVDDASTIRMPVAAECRTSDDVPVRMAVAKRLTGIEDEAAARDLAVKYQLATRLTSFVVVADRDADGKAQDLPATVSVPHMLAAGWGGTSQLAVQTRMRPDPMALRRGVRGMRVAASASLGGFESSRKIVFEDLSIDAADYIARSVDSSQPSETSRDSFSSGPVSFEDAARAKVLAALRKQQQAGKPAPTRFSELVDDYSVPEDVMRALVEIEDATGASEDDIVAVFIALLVEHDPSAAGAPGVLAAIRNSVFSGRQYRLLRRHVTERVFA
jgi:Ca-activated chloride channel family protein